MADHRFQAVYYRASDDSEPVREFVAALNERSRIVLLSQIDRLNLLSNSVSHLPFPHSSQVEGELRELRCHVGSELFRVLYRRSDRLLVLLHVFRKKTKKLPEGEIEIARRRWENYRERMGEEPRRPPRAAGHDALESQVATALGDLAKVLRSWQQGPIRRRHEQTRN